MKDRIEKMAFEWEKHHALKDWTRKDVVEFVVNLALCDCHTWPTLEEAHRYIEVLEAKLRLK